MLRLNKTEEQGVRLALRLAQVDRQLTQSELATRENLPQPTVAKLLGQLRRAGIIEAVRGRHGGYQLAGPPEKISVAATLTAVGGDPVSDHQCLADPTPDNPCPRTGDCGIRSILRHLSQQVTNLLESTTLADLMRTEADVRDHARQLWPDIPASPESGALDTVQASE